MTKTEEQELAREITIYRIQKDFGDKSNTFRIDKIVAGVELDYYHVQINPVRVRKLAKMGTLWCDCQGFRIQNFPKDKHKHILIGFDYISRGQPPWAEYNIIGTGKNAKIEFLRSSNAT